MILNYIKMAFRNIIKQKLYSLINIFGLAIGMTGTMLILVYVFNEISYENFHENKDRIFRIGVQFGSNDSAIKLAGAMPAIAPALEEEISFVEKAVRFNLARKAVIKIENDEYQESNFFFTDSNVFSVFTFHVIEKLKNNPLDEPYTAAISESTAKKLFNDENPIGKTFIYNDNYTIKVTAVFADIEGNTHLKPNILVSYKTKEIIDPVEQPWNSWGEAFTYVLLNNKSEAGKLKENINSIFAKHTNEHFAKMFTFHIEPLPDIYLKSEMNGDLIEHGNLSYVYLFSSIAILVFIIACLNFINLSTARSFHRSKEVGVRKVLGANRTQLIRQFLSESVIISLISLIASLILFELLYPVLNNFLGSALIIDHHRTIEFYLLAFSIFLIVGLIAGMYPAFYLSYFNPIKTVDLNRIVKGNGLGFRRILVIVQFAISTILIFGTTVIYQQLNYMKNTDLGFDKNNVLLISFAPKGEEGKSKYEVLKEKLKRDPNILAVSGAYTVPGLNNNEQQGVNRTDDPFENDIMMRAIGVDIEYANALGIEIIEGRNFSNEYSTDLTNAVIINEAAAKTLNFDEPIGKMIKRPAGSDEFNHAKVIGVMKDFHIQSLHNSIEPLFLYINQDRFYTIAVKISGNNTKETLTHIRSVWNEVIPNSDFSYNFLNDTYNNLYLSEERISQVFSIFSFFAIYIASLGLFGLSSFSAERRTKEIGIRKVLGSSINGIIALLSLDYVKLVVISTVLSLPVSFYLMSEWLDGFAYKIDLNFIPFLLSAIGSLLIALITVSFQAVKAARQNPVNSLRYE